MKTTSEQFLAAARKYESGMVSQEKAAHMAGMSRLDFMMAISALGISPFQYTAEDVLKEVDDLRGPYFKG